MHERPVPTRVRLVLCVVVAVFAADYSHYMATHIAFHRDVGQLWFAAREVLAGRDPYRAIGPGQAYEWPWPLYYPLPGVLAFVPLAPLPQAMAMGAFAGLGFGAFTWALSEYGYAPLVGLLSFCTWHALHLVQWSPFLAASLVLPPIAVLLIAKPTVGTALFIARPSWWAVGGAFVLLAVSFAVQPAWLRAWFTALNSVDVEQGKHAGHFAAIQFPGGALALTALARWRRPEARLVAALSCVPQTLLPYEAVLLLLVPRGWVESIAMAALSYAMYYVVALGPSGGFIQRTRDFGWAVTWLMYLPAAVMVLRRPNHGAIPAWLERAIERLPDWLRGRAFTA